MQPEFLRRFRSMNGGGEIAVVGEACGGVQAQD